MTDTNDNLDGPSGETKKPASPQAFMMNELRRAGVLAQLHKAGLMTAPEKPYQPDEVAAPETPQDK